MRWNWYPPAPKSYRTNKATDMSRVIADTKMAKYQASLGRFLGRNMDSPAPASGTRMVNNNADWSKLFIGPITSGYLETSHQNMASPTRPRAMARA